MNISPIFQGHQLTWIIVGVGDDKHLQCFLIPLVRLVRYVEALFPHSAVYVVELQERVHVQHLQRQQRRASEKESTVSATVTVFKLMDWLVQQPHLDVSSAVAARSELAVLGLDGEESGTAVEGKHPGTVGTSERQLAAGGHSSCVRQLHHRVLYVADDLVIFLQELLQLLYSVLQH